VRAMIPTNAIPQTDKEARRGSTASSRLPRIGTPDTQPAKQQRQQAQSPISSSTRGRDLGHQKTPRPQLGSSAAASSVPGVLLALHSVNPDTSVANQGEHEMPITPGTKRPLL